MRIQDFFDFGDSFFVSLCPLHIVRDHSLCVPKMAFVGSSRQHIRVGWFMVPDTSLKQKAISWSPRQLARL